jgi:hypothetical protein
MSMQNPNDPFGNRTRDLPPCSAVPQPNAPPRDSAGTGIILPRVKRPGCKVDHLSPPSAEVKNEWIHRPTPTPPRCVHGLDRGNFSF